LRSPTPALAGTSGPPTRAPGAPPGDAAGRRARAGTIIRDHAWIAAGANLVPFAVLDSLAISAVQLRMFAALSHLYGRSFDGELRRNAATALGMGLAHHAFVRATPAQTWLLVSAAAPVLGGVLAVAARPAVFGAVTYFLGHACVRHYEAGGHFGDFGPRQLAGTPLAPFAVHLLRPHGGSPIVLDSGLR
jgi:uncharacterized protein (DUF697 family)